MCVCVYVCVCVYTQPMKESRNSATGEIFNTHTQLAVRGSCLQFQSMCFSLPCVCVLLQPIAADGVVCVLFETACFTRQPPNMRVETCDSNTAATTAFLFLLFFLLLLSLFCMFSSLSSHLSTTLDVHQAGAALQPKKKWPGKRAVLDVFSLSHTNMKRFELFFICGGATGRLVDFPVGWP